MILYLAGLLMPYLAVGLGLLVFHNAWVAILAYHAGILLILRIAGYKNPISFRITIPIWKLLAFAAAGGIGGIAVLILWPFVLVSSSLMGMLEQWGLTHVTWPLFIAYSALVNPWLEELYWRGWLGSADRRPVGNDAAFAGFHLFILAPFISVTWLIVTLVIMTVAAWLWRQVTRRAKSLLPAVLSHLAADVSILLAIVSEIT